MHVPATRTARFFDVTAHRLPGPAGTAGGLLIRSVGPSERTRGEFIVNEQPFGRRGEKSAFLQVPMGVDEQLPAGDYIVTLVGSVPQTYRIPLSGSDPAPRLRPSTSRSVTHAAYAVTASVQASWAEPVAISSRDFVFEAYSETGNDEAAHALSVCVTGRTFPCLPAPAIGIATGSGSTHTGAGASYFERGSFLDGDHTWLGAGASGPEGQQLQRHLVTVTF